MRLVLSRAKENASGGEWNKTDEAGWTGWTGRGGGARSRERCRNGRSAEPAAHYKFASFARFRCARQKMSQSFARPWHRISRSFTHSLAGSLSLLSLAVFSVCISFCAPWAKCQLLSWRTRQKVCWNNVKHNLHTISALPFFFSAPASPPLLMFILYWCWCWYWSWWSLCLSVVSGTHRHSLTHACSQCSFDTNLIYVTRRETSRLPAGRRTTATRNLL